jgi:hypothetical protein
MFDSIEEQMKHHDLDGTPKEKWTKYLIISAVSVCAVGAIFGAVHFLR